MKKIMNNEDGFALVAALVIMLMLMSIAGAAMTLSQLGSISVGSEKKYLLASAAAEYALNDALIKVGKGTVSCGTVQTSTRLATATYRYITIADVAGSSCFIQASGQFGGAIVVRTAVVSVPLWGGVGAVTLRGGGSVELSGSSSIENCDSASAGACAGAPAIMTGGTFAGNADNSANHHTSCGNNNKGVTAANSSPLRKGAVPDLVPRLFQAVDWSDFLARLSANYNIVLDANGVPSGFKAGTPSLCQYTGPNNCRTTGAAALCCDSGAGGGCSVAEVDISECANIYVATELTVNNALSAKTIVSPKEISVKSSADTTLTDLNIFSKVVDIEPSAGSAAVEGGTFYGSEVVQVEGHGGARVGTTEKPVLIITGKEFEAENKSSGNTEINGLVFANNSTEFRNEGALRLNGAFVNNNPAPKFARKDGNEADVSIKDTGSAAIKYDGNVLRNLSTNLPGLVKSPVCGNSPVSGSTVTRTKMTAY